MYCSSVFKFQFAPDGECDIFEVTAKMQSQGGRRIIFVLLVLMVACKHYTFISSHGTKQTTQAEKICYSAGFVPTF
jgi:hypothetical protein